MSSEAVQKILQEAFILATGRGANATELAAIEAMSGPNGDYAPLKELVNQYMGDLAASAGAEATVKTVAMNGLGLKLADSDAAAIAANITSGAMTWADGFLLCINLTDGYGTTLDNRAEAAYGFLASLSSESKSAYYQGEAPYLAVTNLLSGIGASAASLAVGTSGLDALAARLESNGIQSTVVDGTINGATVFVDADGDGTLDSGEFSTTTDTAGNFVLPSATDGGKIIAHGGTDLMTGRPFQGVLTAPAGATVVNPITTLLQSMVAAGQSIAAATSALQTALGLPTAVNPLSYDPIAVLAEATASAADKTAALKVQAIATQIANVISQVGAAIEAASNTTRLPAGDAVIAELAKTVASANTVNLGNFTTLSAITQAAATAAGAGSLTVTQVSAIARIGEASNLAARAAATITDLAMLAVVAQSSAPDAIAAALTGSGDLADAVAAFTGSGLTAAVAGAHPGVVPGTPDTLAPVMRAAAVSADGQSIVVTYSEALSGTPEAKDYAVSASSGAVSITQATLGTGADNNKVILALSDTVLGNVTLSNLAYSAESGTFYSIKDAAAEPNASAPQTLASVANGSAVAATFTVTETGGAVTFSGTVKGDISVSWSGILGASVATFTRGGVAAETTPDFLGSATKITIGTDQTLADSAADIQGVHIDGPGNVAVTALDAKPGANLSLITSTGTRMATVENDVTFTGYLGTFTISVAENKTLTAELSVLSGKTIEGTGNITVTGVTDATALTNIANTIATLTLQGTSAADTINASRLAKQGVVIEGGAGADVLTGGDGADRFVYGVAADLAAGESVAGGANTVGRDALVLKGAAQSYDLAANLSFSGIEEIDTSAATGATGVTLSDAQLGTATPLLTFFTGSASASETFAVNVAAEASGAAGVKSVLLDSTQRTLTGLTPGADKFAVNVAATNAFTTSYSVKLSHLGDQVTLTDGNNLATGGSGNDTMSGGSGSDTLDGGAGDDSLTGAAGADSMSGGSGNDRFAWATRADSRAAGFAAGNTTTAYIDGITDFTGNGAAAGDTIQLGLGANAFGAALQFTVGTTASVTAITVATAADFTALTAGAEAVTPGTASTGAVAQIYDVTVSAGNLAGRYLIANDDTAAIAATDTIISITGVTGALDSGDFLFA
ncbi:MAG: hypothetical protein A3G25_05400 [Betaproteobacteria bacterium RIFCSPLOWO2_12_FULL_63_13]|nr:MAG: hypothetical protein A3G25_05400 [Betaproteobacteria bacterium RIFCSPLOWO2_12_FULL_63_13]